MDLRTVDILVPVALDQTYTYRVPAGLALAPGDVASRGPSGTLTTSPGASARPAGTR